MNKGREELRRGIREVIEHASREMDALASEPVLPAGTRSAEARPILRLVRDPAVPSPAAPSRAVPPAPPAGVDLPEVSVMLPKRGVCQAYFVNRRCWELPEAFCNTALHVCMTRECPVYHLYKEELERRFAAKFAHFW